MFIFGHIGITLGILTLLKQHPALSKMPTSLYVVAFGAMLPDLIDKTLGEVIFANSIGNGRIYGHTLLFCLLLLLTAIHLYKKKEDKRLLIIPAASFLHLMEDRLWMTPQTLFWPLMGWQFPDGYYSTGILDYFLGIFRNAYTPALSYVFVSEIIGISILCIAGIAHFKKSKITH